MCGGERAARDVCEQRDTSSTAARWEAREGAAETDGGAGPRDAGAVRGDGERTRSSQGRDRCCRGIPPSTKHAKFKVHDVAVRLNTGIYSLRCEGDR